MEATRKRLYAWLDERLAISSLQEFARHKTVPVHRFAAIYYLGGMTLFFFLVQVLTGILLMVYYRPSAAEAFVSVVCLMLPVSFGLLIRSLHSWSPNLIIFFAFLPLASVYFAKAYRPPRELTWITGCLAFFLALGFSGYLLPWDELAFFATRVGTQIPSTIPVVGEFVTRFLRGGDRVTSATISRFFGWHVAILPALMTVVLGLHLLLVQLLGMSVPPAADGEARRRRPMRFLPHYALRDLFGWLLALGVLGTLAALLPWELGAKADAFAPAPKDIRPEWYFMFMFETLKLVPGGSIWGLESTKRSRSSGSVSPRSCWCWFRSSTAGRRATAAAPSSPPRGSSRSSTWSRSQTGVTARWRPCTPCSPPSRSSGFSGSRSNAERIRTDDEPRGVRRRRRPRAARGGAVRAGGDLVHDLPCQARDRRDRRRGLGGDRRARADGRARRRWPLVPRLPRRQPGSGARRRPRGDGPARGDSVRRRAEARRRPRLLRPLPLRSARHEAVPARRRGLRELPFTALARGEARHVGDVRTMRDLPRQPRHRARHDGDARPLTTSTARAERMLLAARRGGVELRKVTPELDAAVTAQIELQVLVHTFSSAPEGKFVTRYREGMQHAEQALAGVREALHELASRRRGLVVFLGFLVLVLVAMVLKIRQISRED